MQVENYIIILSLVKHADNLDIKYKILPEAAEGSIVIRNNEGDTIKTFSKLKPTNSGLVNFSTKELAAGKYTCTSIMGIQEGRSLNFTID